MLSKPLILLAVIFMVGCGAQAAEPTATPGPKVIQPNFTPTPTYTPPPTIQPTYTPYPTPDIEVLLQARLAEILATQEAMQEPTSPTGGVTVSPTPTFTPEPTATREPTPTPQPPIRAVKPPEQSASALTLSSASIDNAKTLHISGIIRGNGYDPTVIQVFQSYESEPFSETCSTEKPVAFIRPGGGSVVYTGQNSLYEWRFCTRYQQGKTQVAQVPWLYSQHWSYKLRHRDRTTDPYIYDFAVSASLDHERVESLEYGSVAAGYRVIIWSGDNILASAWIDY